MRNGSAREGVERCLCCVDYFQGRTRLTLKLERREEISVEGAAEKDEYENVVQGRGD